MKICMITYSQYEFDNRVHRYAESLVMSNHQVDVICLGTKGQMVEEELNGVIIYRISTRSYAEKSPLSYLTGLLYFFHLSFVKCTLLQFKKRYDLMHFHNIPDFGVFCTLIPKLLGAKIILDIHDLVPEFYQRKFGLNGNHIVIRVLKWIEKWASKYADHIITVTQIWKEKLVQRSVEEYKCSVILNAPEPGLFKKKVYKIKSGRPFKLIYLGNLTEIFGVDIAIKAMSNVRKEIPDVELNIYGQGKNKIELKKLVKDLGLEEWVFFHRPVSRFQVPQILYQADLGIDPKRDGVLAGEGLSSKCLEYLAIGLPAVVSKIKAAKTYYNDSMVMFFEPDNEEDLAEKIVYLYKNPEKRMDMIKHSEMFNREHNWNRYFNRYIHILNSLVTKHRKYPPILNRIN